MRKRLAIGAMAVAAVAVAGCSSSGGSRTSAAGTPSTAGSAASSAQPGTGPATGPATGTAACDQINHDLNSIMGGAAKAKATSKLSVQEARQAQLATNLEKSARVFIDDQSEAGITPKLRQAEQTIAGNVDSYYANYHKPDSGNYGMKIINALGQVKQECGTAPWQTAI